VERIEEFPGPKIVQGLWEILSGLWIRQRLVVLPQVQVCNAYRRAPARAFFIRESQRLKGSGVAMSLVEPLLDMWGRWRQAAAFAPLYHDNGLPFDTAILS
jgi:hypothetical protein